MRYTGGFLALILSVTTAAVAWGDIIQIGDITADDGRNALFIHVTADEADGYYDYNGIFHMPSPQSVLVISHGGRFYCDAAYFSADGDATGERQIRITGSAPEAYCFSDLGVLGGARTVLDGVMTISDNGRFTSDRDVTFWDGAKMYIHLSRSYYAEDSPNSQPLDLSDGAQLVLNADVYEANARALNLCANVFLSDGVYTPVACANELYDGVAAFGGTWDGAAKTFTISDEVHIVAPGNLTELASGSRYVIETYKTAIGKWPGDGFDLKAGDGKLDLGDGPKDWVTETPLGVSTLDKSAEGKGTLPYFTATPGGWSTSDDLAIWAAYLLAKDRPADLLAVWEIDLQSDDDELYYSMNVGQGQERLTLFTLVDDVWLEYSGDLLILNWGSMAYDTDGMLGFVAPKDMTMFAVFGDNPAGAFSIPEPASLCLLALGGLALLRRRR